MRTIIRASGCARKQAFRPDLTGLEDRTLLATLVVNPVSGPYTTIQSALTAAMAGDTIAINPATYTEQVTINTSLTMMGTAPGVIIQAPSMLTPDLGQASLMEIGGGATVNINDLTLNGPGPITIINGNSIAITGIYVVGGATANVTGTTIDKMRQEPLGGFQSGRGILVGSTGQNQVGHATITDCTITDYQKSGIVTGGNGTTVTITGTTITGVGPTAVIAQNGIAINTGTTATVTNDTITGNQFTGTNSGPDPTRNVQASGILIDGSAPTLPGGSVTVGDNTISGNDLGINSISNSFTVSISANTVQGNFEGIVLQQGTASVSNNSINGNNIGVAVIAFPTDSFGTPVTVNAEGNLVSNNIFNNGNTGLLFPGGGIRLLIAPQATTTALATANFNRIVGNSVGLDNTTTSAVDATLDWWGSDTGPNTTGNDTTLGSVNTSPWLVLSIAASLGTIGPGGTTSVTASVINDSSGATHSSAPFFPNGIPITFGASAGTISPASVPTQSGTASSSFTSTSAGTPSASATLDNQTVSITITVQAIVVPPPPTPQQKTEGESFSQSFAATGGAGGFVYTVSAGALAPDLVLDRNTGLVSGPLTTPGTYTFTVTATDASGGSVSHSLTIVVARAVAAPVVQDLQRFGFHAQPTTFVLTFSTALEQATAEDVANYVLKRIDGQHLGPAIPMQSAVYDPTAHTVTLHPTHGVYLFARYHLLVNGSTSTGVAGDTGLLLDGEGNGHSGSDFVTTFGKEILAGPNSKDPPAKHSPLHRTRLQAPQPRRHVLTISTPASRSHALSVLTVNAVRHREIGAT